jgi:dolichyl-phosphate beta-glucosyltransferase
MATLPQVDDRLLSSNTGQKCAPPTAGPAAVALSVVIPAFNEVERLPTYLRSILEYLPRLYGDLFEILIVDDGSQDGTAEMLKEFQCDWPQLQVLRHPTNRGKGAAVRTGMVAAAGELLLFADADGATPIDEEQRLREAIRDGADVAAGSRLVASRGAERSRNGLRLLASRVFARLTRWALRLPVNDTQCGFKMFRRPAAQQIFRACDEPGYLFDVHVLLLARNLGYSVAEVGISWHDVPGSKVCLWRDSWKMAKGLWNIRRRVARQTSLARSVNVEKAPRPETHAIR